MIKKFNCVGLVIDPCPRIKVTRLPQWVEADTCAKCPNGRGVDWKKREVMCGVATSLALYECFGDTPVADEVAPGCVDVCDR